MTKEDVLRVKRFFEERDIRIVQICLILDVVIVQYPDGEYHNYKLKNFRS